MVNWLRVHWFVGLFVCLFVLVIYLLLFVEHFNISFPVCIFNKLLSIIILLAIHFKLFDSGLVDIRYIHRKARAIFILFYMTMVLSCSKQIALRQSLNAHSNICKDVLFLRKVAYNIFLAIMFLLIETLANRFYD